ncbi:MAG: CCA tRNA nucleotidyltransferase [Desulfamplus sp.]|nr:CCA tRNA nucleotidyltransferase [Desulfamplus sp.]
MKTIEDTTTSLDIVKNIKSAGFKAFFVGGFVRDLLIGINKEKMSDLDILTNASVEDIIKIFGSQNVKQVGKSFSICLVNGIEIASCRADSYRSSELSKISQSSKSKLYDSFPECDLAHRDITINSMALDPLTNTIIDPFNGRKDLEDKIIRFTGSPEERIFEDPLRMVRVCRFASMIQGTIDSSTLSSIVKHRHLVTKSVAPERLRNEIIKAMAYKKPSLFFKALNSAKLLEFIFPSLSRCCELDGGPHHGETVFEHCLMSGDALSPRNPILRLAGFLHDAGKYDAAQIKDGQLTFIDHEKMGQSIIYDLEKLRFSCEEINFIDSVIKTHMRPLKADSTPKAVRRLLAFLKEHGVEWQTFMQMRIADKSANLAKKPYTQEDIKLRVGKIWNELKNANLKGASLPLSVKELAISGDDVMEILNISPSPEVGKVMNYLFESVLDEPCLNKFEILKELVITYNSKN